VLALLADPNRSNRSNRSHAMKPIHDRLYRQKDDAQLKIQKKGLKTSEDRAADECTFRPTFETKPQERAGRNGASGAAGTTSASATSRTHSSSSVAPPAAGVDKTVARMRMAAQQREETQRALNAAQYTDESYRRSREMRERELSGRSTAKPKPLFTQINGRPQRHAQGFEGFDASTASTANTGNTRHTERHPAPSGAMSLAPSVPPPAVPPQAMPKLYMEVELGGGKSGRIALYDGSEPSALGVAFARDQGLPSSVVPKLTALIRQTMDANGVQ
jgi:hypothetical protein